MKFFHHEDSQAWEQTDQKSSAFPVPEIVKIQLVKILRTSQAILSYFVIARCLASFLSTLPWHQILAEIADTSAVSLLPLLLSLYEERIWQNALEENELASLYMPDTKHTGMCRQMGKPQARPKSFRHHYPLNTKVSSSNCKRFQLDFHVLKQKTSLKILFSGVFSNI